jgi:hypothetical protein
MFVLVRKTFLAKKACKKSADLHPRQGNLLQRHIFTGLNKPLLTAQNRLEEKNRPFFQHPSSMYAVLRFLWPHNLLLVRASMNRQNLYLEMRRKKSAQKCRNYASGVLVFTSKVFVEIFGHFFHLEAKHWRFEKKSTIS